MRVLIIVILVLGTAIGFTLLAQRDPGYVLINYAGWSVESSFSIFLLAAAIAFFAFYLLLRLLFGTLHLPRRAIRWRRHHKAVQTRELTNKGLIALAEGNWARAEKKLSRSAADSQTPLINYLGAARAAQKQGAEIRRDEYLSQAYQSMPDAELAVGLTQADLQLSQGQVEQALATLHYLRTVAPKHGYVLYLLKKLYEKMQSWDELSHLLPDLHKHHVLEEDDYSALEHRVHSGRLKGAASLQKLEDIWLDLPRKLHHAPDLLFDYAECLCRINEEQKAEAVLRDYLKKHWDPTLIRLYGRIRGADLNKQQDTAEHWLREYEHHPELLLALGRLSLQNQLWGKARSYLEASLGAEPRAETCCELGNLLSQLGEDELAAAYFRQGLEMISGEHCTEFTVMGRHLAHAPSHTE
ncbi:MAG: heme biosynthesis HemY N-terminal domain-containing protein [Pseudomonadota bacterium]